MQGIETEIRANIHNFGAVRNVGGDRIQQVGFVEVSDQEFGAKQVTDVDCHTQAVRELNFAGPAATRRKRFTHSFARKSAQLYSRVPVLRFPEKCKQAGKRRFFKLRHPRKRQAALQRRYIFKILR